MTPISDDKWCYFLHWNYSLMAGLAATISIWFLLMYFVMKYHNHVQTKLLKYWSIQINIRFLVLFLPFISITCNIGISCYSTIMTVRIWSTNMSWWWWVSDTEEKIYGSWLGFINCLLVKRIQIWNALTLFLLSLSSDVWVRFVDYCVTDLDGDSIM